MGCVCNEAPVEQAKEAKEDERFERTPDARPLLLLELDTGDQWAKAIDMNTLFMAIQRYQTAGLNIRLVAGNTGTGMAPILFLIMVSCHKTYYIYRSLQVRRLI